MKSNYALSLTLSRSRSVCVCVLQGVGLYSPVLGVVESLFKPTVCSLCLVDFCYSKLLNKNDNPSWILSTL